MPETVYLEIADVLFLHEEQLRLFGGAPGVRDEGLVLSALLRPRTGYYRDLIEEAAALWDSLAMNHGFVDGNKRVAFESLVIFLGMNGYDLTATPEAAIAFIYQNLEGGTFRKDVLDAWLRQNTAPAS